MKPGSTAFEWTYTHSFQVIETSELVYMNIAAYFKQIANSNLNYWFHYSWRTDNPTTNYMCMYVGESFTFVNSNNSSLELKSIYELRII